jgi:hypothetical protein
LLAGKIFNREQHRDRAWDLIVVRGDPRMELINRLLDGMIVRDPNDRLLSDAGEVVAETRTYARVLAGPYNVVHPTLPQRCHYCGFGQYQLAVRSSADYPDFFGPRPVGRANWRALVCDQCGHVQTFRIDSASRRQSWWQDTE